MFTNFQLFKHLTPHTLILQKDYKWEKLIYILISETTQGKFLIKQIQYYGSHLRKPPLSIIRINVAT